MQSIDSEEHVLKWYFYEKGIFPEQRDTLCPFTIQHQK